MMRATNMGDMAHNFMLQKRNIALKQDINRLTEELATGQVAEVRQVLNGNYSYLTEIERSMDVLKGYDVATAEATHLAVGMQNALDRVNSLGQDLSHSLLFAGVSSAGASGATEIANEAEQSLNSMIGVINTRVSGRALFSGIATDTAPLAPAADLLAGLRSAVAGAVTVDDMITASKVWFDDPFGFSATVYQGSGQSLAPVSLSDTESVTLNIHADDRELRESLRTAAIAALATDPTLGLTPGQQTELFEKAGAEMLAARDQVTSLQARVGFAEARIDQTASRNEAELTGLEYARSALLSVDPYQAATQLESVQFQLQSLYAVTVRMSQLSLVNFL